MIFPFADRCIDIKIVHVLVFEFSFICFGLYEISDIRLIKISNLLRG